MTFKAKQQIKIRVSGAGCVSYEDGTVLRVRKGKMWLDNGQGNEPSGPFDAETGKDLRESGFGFSITVLPKEDVE